MAEDKMKFNSLQVSRFLTIVENQGLKLCIDSDAQASALFSALLIEMFASLESQQEMALIESLSYEV